MAQKTIAAGKTIVQSGQAGGEIYIITQGSVTARCDGDELYLKKGDVIGVLELANGYYSYDYVAETDVTAFTYPCKNHMELLHLIKSNSDMAGFIVTSTIRTVCHIADSYIMAKYNADNLYRFLIESYKQYKALCMKCAISAKELPTLRELAPLKAEDDIAPWISPYYESAKAFSNELIRKVFIDNPEYLAGYLYKAGEDACAIIGLHQELEEFQSSISTILLNENHLDILDLYTSLLPRLHSNPAESMSLNAIINTLLIQMEGRPSLDEALYKRRVEEYRKLLQDSEENANAPSATKTEVPTADLDNSLDQILAYANLKKETADEFRQLIAKYKDVIDKTALNDSLNALRRKLTSLFYEVYIAAFQKSLNDSNIPTVVKMLFLFGYVDETIAGPENAAMLYQLAKEYKGDAEHGIYTLYEWLVLIYEGKKEPSRNEFDNDYPQYLRELRTGGRINEAQERQYLTDTAQKVMYELRNMFPSVNKVTFGKISTYCPIFSEHNLLLTPDKMLQQTTRITECVEQLRTIDYTLFYRDTLFSDPAAGVPKETIMLEVLPDIILMPNVGLRGIMWQEIEGKRRNTPARMMIPIMLPEDPFQILTRLAGEYRWEMCKRVQGSRWNDISDMSLTSEYFDYIQFYRKNSDLSADVKEKIKILLQKTKGNYRETFVRDYISWITLESKGSPVLNKVCRRILFAYCPFSKALREKLEINPLYREYLERFNVKTRQKLHHLDNLCKKISNTGRSIPPEIENQSILLTK